MVRGKGQEIVGSTQGARVRCLDQKNKIYAVYMGESHRDSWRTFKVVRWFIAECGRVFNRWQRFVRGVILGTNEQITICLGYADRKDVLGWKLGQNGNKDQAFHAGYLLRAALRLVGAEACLRIGLLALAPARAE